MTKDMADSSAPMRCSDADGPHLPHNAARSDDVPSRGSIITEPMYRFAKERLDHSRTCWLPWRRWYWKGFATGLIAGADLIHRFDALAREETDTA